MPKPASEANLRVRSRPPSKSAPARGADVDFDAGDLGRVLERLSRQEIDELPFGVIKLDRDCVVEVYSETEMQQSGFGRRPIGEAFFPLTRCLGTDDMRRRIEGAMAEGDVDFELGWSGDYNDPKRDIRIRVVSARPAGVWMCFERDPV